MPGCSGAPAGAGLATLYGYFLSRRGAFLDRGQPCPGHLQRAPWLTAADVPGEALVDGKSQGRPSHADGQIAEALAILKVDHDYNLRSSG